MRILLPVLLLATSPALSDECGDLIETVAAAAKAEIGDRSADFANFTAGYGVTLTLSCGGLHASSVGAQYRGETPPDAYYATFAEAGGAVTGISSAILQDAARRAQADATRLRHSTVSAGGALVTCSFGSSSKGALTMCAVIEHGDRS